MKKSVNRAIRLLLGSAIFVSLTACGAVAREKENPLSAARVSSSDVAGLQAPGQILVDVWGIPHIYAENEHDLFFLQGFNAARDRLWQIDLWRKRGLGLLAKDFGAGYVEQDKALRLFLYRGDMKAEWAAYGPKAKTYAEAFVAGVNAYVGDVQAGRRPRPIEFRIAGTMPDLWSADDVVRIRSHGLTRNIASEVKRSLVACAAGLEADRLRVKLEPSWTTKIPEGLDPCSVPKAVLGAYDLATRPVAFAAPKDQKAALAHDPDQYLAEADQQRDTIGSNNWVVAPSRTATGRAILANDPHREHSVPSLMPVPGDGRYEWQGFLSPDDLPRVYRPKQGWFATANQMNLPDDYPVTERKVGFEWADSARWQRIVEVLQANRKMTLADAMDLQNDDTSMLARRLVALLKPLSSDDANVGKGLELLKGWDARDSADSAAAAVFEVWIANHLGKELLKAAAPKAADLIAPEASGIPAMVGYLETPDAALGAEPKAARDRILRDSLGSAVADVTGKLGADSTSWRWDRLHVAKFDHALMPPADKATASQLSVGPLAYGGAGNVPRAATYRRSDYRLIGGASFRMVLNVGSWDASRTINTPGQSGDPFSGHYRDMAPLWATGQYVPLLYSRAAVEAATAEAITLKPR